MVFIFSVIFLLQHPNYIVLLALLMAGQPKSLAERSAVMRWQHDDLMSHALQAYLTKWKNPNHHNHHGLHKICREFENLYFIEMGVKVSLSHATSAHLSDGDHTHLEAQEHCWWLTNIKDDVVINFLLEMGQLSWPANHHRNFQMKALARIGLPVLCRCILITSKWWILTLLKGCMCRPLTPMQIAAIGISFMTWLPHIKFNQRQLWGLMKLDSTLVVKSTSASLLHTHRKDHSISKMVVPKKIPLLLLPSVQMEHWHHLPLFSRVLHTKWVGERIILSMLHEFSTFFFLSELTFLQHWISKEKLDMQRDWCWMDQDLWPTNKAQVQARRILPTSGRWTQLSLHHCISHLRMWEPHYCSMLHPTWHPYLSRPWCGYFLPTQEIDWWGVPLVVTTSYHINKASASQDIWFMPQSLWKAFHSFAYDLFLINATIYYFITYLRSFHCLSQGFSLCISVYFIVTFMHIRVFHCIFHCIPQGFSLWFSFCISGYFTAFFIRYPREFHCNFHCSVHCGHQGFS